jgi:hypothetical protein
VNEFIVIAMISLKKGKLVRFVKIAEWPGGAPFALRKTKSASTRPRGAVKHERRPLIRPEEVGFASPKSPDRIGGIAPGRANSPRPIGGGRQAVEA